MRVELSRLHKEIGATMIYVTHDQVEAMTMADKIVVLRDGRVEQIGTPMDLYSNPCNRFVASFIGSPSMNFFSAEVSKIGLKIPAISQTIKTDTTLPKIPFEVGIRPEHLKIVSSEDGAQVEIIEKLGGLTYVYLEALNGEKIVVSTHEICDLTLGDFVQVSCNPSQVSVFDKRTGNCL
jgi:lactose/L-arabinose transport system ATP-binding protein